MDVYLGEDVTDEELVGQAGNALEALTAHMGKTFLKSGNLRGMAESYNKLAAPFGGETRAEPVRDAYNMIAIGDNVAEKIAKALLDIRQLRESDVIEGTEKS
jgi:hypothetical protein